MLVEQIQIGQIEDWQWKKIVTKMYDQEDVQVLVAKFRECIEMRKLRKENTPQSSHRLNSNSQSRKMSRDEELARRK